MAEALYRKYRPQTFQDVVGQQHIERTLKNAIDQDKVSHAYLFCGPRGTGKTTTARLLAKALLCQQGPTSSPDGTCQACLDIADGVHPDVYELDAASRTGVENVREEIIGRVQFAPTRGKKKIYIIDEVHMLSTAAFNALLKTLEEPPSHVVFVLCTTDPQKVPETIHSRCQRFDFHRLSTEEIVTRLGAVCMAEDVQFEGDALELIAHRAEGGMRNALTALEQMIAFGEGNVTVKAAENMLGSLDSSDMAEIMQAVGRRDVAACFTWVANYVETGADLAQFARDMAEHVRNLYVLAAVGDDASLEITEEQRRQLVSQLPLFGKDRLARLLDIMGDVVSELRVAVNQRLCFEIALTRMVRPESDVTLASLAERIEALEQARHVEAEAVPARTAAAVQEGAQPARHIDDQPQRTDDTRNIGGSPDAADALRKSNADVPSSEKAQPVAQAADASSAQARQTAEAQTGATASAFGNAAALQRMWKIAAAAVKKANISHGVYLMGVKVSVDETGEGLYIDFPATNIIAFEQACKPEMQESLSQALQQAHGSAVAFKCRCAGAKEQSDAAQQRHAATDAVQQAAREAAGEAVASNAERTPDNAGKVSGQVSAEPDYDAVPLSAYDGRIEEDELEAFSDEASSQAKNRAAQAAKAGGSPDTATTASSDKNADTDEKSELDRILSQSMGVDVSFEELP